MSWSGPGIPQAWRARALPPRGYRELRSRPIAVKNKRVGGFAHEQSNRLWPVRRFNPRRVKIHRTFTVDEVARLFSVHNNTVRAWIKSGLPTTDARRPILILGRELARFLHARRQRTRQQCQPGQLYCLRCRAPREPASRMAAYVPITPSSGNLRGQCGDCGVLMWRRVSLMRLSGVAGALDVAFQEAQPRIEDNPCFSLNSDLAQEASTHANTQPGK